MAGFVCLLLIIAGFVGLLKYFSLTFMCVLLGAAMIVDWCQAKEPRKPRHSRRK
jgi:general stress protein CsbA